MNTQNGRTDGVALLVGAAGGTGLPAALRLAACGLDIALVDSDPSPAQETLRRITATGRRCTALAADPADTAAFSAALDRVRSALGSPTILMTCVDAATPDGPEPSGNGTGGRTVGAAYLAGAPARYASARRALRTLFVTNRAVAGAMLRGGGGRILNVAGPPRPQRRDECEGRTGGRDRREGRTVVAGMAGFTASLASELAPFGITVHFAGPAALRPGARPPVGGPPPADTGSYPEHLAHHAAHLLDGPASALTGQGVYLGGGPTARRPATTTTRTSRGTVATP